MTVLSDSQILEALKTGELKFEPSDISACLNPAGYDLRIAKTVIVKPKHYELVATLETVELGLNVVATLHIRSSLAREGLIGSFAVVDPGFRGQLTLNLHNVGEKEVTLKEGERIVQIMFHQLGSSAKKGYSGSYQDSKGIVKSRRNNECSRPANYQNGFRLKRFCLLVLYSVHFSRISLYERDSRLLE